MLLQTKFPRKTMWSMFS